MGSLRPGLDQFHLPLSPHGLAQGLAQRRPSAHTVVKDQVLIDHLLNKNTRNKLLMAIQLVLDHSYGERDEDVQGDF